MLVMLGDGGIKTLEQQIGIIERRNRRGAVGHA